MALRRAAGTGASALEMARQAGPGPGSQPGASPAHPADPRLWPGRGDVGRGAARAAGPAQGDPEVQGGGEARPDHPGQARQEPGAAEHGGADLAVPRGHGEVCSLEVSASGPGRTPWVGKEQGACFCTLLGGFSS